MADRLFNPGPRSPSQWKLHPDKWVERPDVVYHASEEPNLPRVDRGPHQSLGYGDSAGMHFGNKAAAFERSMLSQRTNIHTARLNTTQFTPADSNLATPGVAPDPVWDDHTANYHSETDKAVREGKAVPYRNEYEANGSTSYRVLPEATKTWSEDVKDDPNAHPALKHLAERGYNPTLTQGDVYGAAQSHRDSNFGGPSQKQLFGGDVVKGGKAVAHHVDAMDAMEESANRRVNKETGVGFKNNNGSTGQFGTLKIVEQQKPRLRPTRPMI